MKGRRLKVPPAPADLKKPAQARWRYAYPILAARGAVDLESLRGYCQLWARWREAEDGLQAAGQLAKGAGGRVVPSPLVALANSTAARVQDLEERLGLHAARTSSSTAADDAGTGGLLTRRGLAARLNVHMMTITKWEREGMPVADRGGKGRASFYAETDVRAWLSSREDAAQKSGLVDVAQERARKERAQAILAEQTFQARARELLPSHEVEKIWSTHIAAVRAKLLMLPPTIADRLSDVAALEGADGIEAALMEAIVNVLRELAEADPAPGVEASPSPLAEARPV